MTRIYNIRWMWEILNILLGITLLQAVSASREETFCQRKQSLNKKYKYISNQWFYAFNSISGWGLMLFYTRKYRIKNEQVFKELRPVLIHKVRSSIKHTQQLSQYLGNWKTLIGYVISEAEDKQKLVDNKCTKSNSQCKTEHTKVRVFFACL